MKYIDRDGNQITADEWARLFRSKRYPLIREDGNDLEAVICSWVGVLSELEPEPKPYFVDHQHKLTDGDGVDRWRSIGSEFFPTEKAALKHFGLILAGIRKREAAESILSDVPA